MDITLRLSITDGDEAVSEYDIIHLSKSINSDDLIGLSVAESKCLLKTLQQHIVDHQARQFIRSQEHCPCCRTKRRVKDYRNSYYRTVFGVVSLSSPRLFYCDCEKTGPKSFSVLSQWLPDCVSPELQYLEAKWASLMSYGLTSERLKEVLPIGESLNASTVRNHLTKVAQRQNAELEGKASSLPSCARDWAALPKPEKPITLGIDGGYLRQWGDKSTNFEVIVGCSMPKQGAAKKFGYVQSIDDNPRRRIMEVLKSQGMQENQQVIFLSDGADNLRAAQMSMYPESEHVLDWFHVTMRLTVLKQYALGMIHTDPTVGERLHRSLSSIKWYLWHGNVEKALDKLELSCMEAREPDLKYARRKSFSGKLDEFYTYIENNLAMIPNYGEKWRYSETITTAFVESTVNEVVAKRMVKKQQMQWSPEGAHALLQTRTATLNGELSRCFQRWYPAFPAANEELEGKSEDKMAA